MYTETTGSFRPAIPSGIRVYPSPFTDLVQIRSEESPVEVALKVYDASGRIQSQHPPVLLERGTPLTISTGTWKPGMYLVEMQNHQGVTVKRILKQP